MRQLVTLGSHECCQATGPEDLSAYLGVLREIFGYETTFACLTGPSAIHCVRERMQEVPLLSHLLVPGRKSQQTFIRVLDIGGEYAETEREAFLREHSVDYPLMIADGYQAEGGVFSVLLKSMRVPTELHQSLSQTRILDVRRSQIQGTATDEGTLEREQFFKNMQELQEVSLTQALA